MPAPLLNMKPDKPSTGSQCVLYARVSSTQQAEEGFSIPAQQRLAREYATAKGLRIMQEFVDVETARRAGREAFGHMVTYLKKHQKTCRIVLCEKVDRLYRNIADWVTIDDIGATIHFVKNGSIIGRDSGSNEQLIHGFQVLMARNYSQNLSEETRKGQIQKALSGIWPSFAPAGYQNVDGPNGKRIIVPEPSEAPIITELYNLFASGTYSLEALVTLARERGMTLRGKRLQKSTLHQVLRKRIYSGDFVYNEITYNGTHEPLVTKVKWTPLSRPISDFNKL